MNAPDPSTRERFHAAQDAWLHAAAVRESLSGGRTYPQPDDPHRTCFQEDRSRVLRCTAFRRLDFKTQVFVPHEHDHFRTRLTHTLEVAQIGRDLGRSLRFNEDLIETVALAHDLGHPPFGHAGEAVLHELMAGFGGFEHNRHSLRVVDYLEHPYPAFRGLNLTQVVRECIARHETRYDTPEAGEFPASLAAPLEGQLVDLADEIAYTAADLEDALHAGWVDETDLADEPLWQQAWQAAQRQDPGAREIHKQIQACRLLVRLLCDDVLEATHDALCRLDPAGPEDIRQAGSRLADFSPQRRREAGRLAEFLYRNVYTHPRLTEVQRRCTDMIRALFEAYVQRPELLPPRYRQRLEAAGAPRVACDYIAGMTDRFCQQEYDRVRQAMRT